ncbi:putative centromere protein [Cladorrhinum samala]|uniref:CENP-C homolog n=1 Tax=Cladorrhinum samala TaxID=585594 RepID=A0AAV9HDF3_9PEZI|nr:putative centromere protein [Cladorrhinum samala]
MPPPRPSVGARRVTQAAEHIYELGVVGRKTGVTIPDSGIRDENGMEPLENLFSSPKKPDEDEFQEVEEDEVEEEDEESDDGAGEAPMDLTTPFTASGAPLLNGQANRFARPAQASQQSPAKTFLNSPAQRNKLIAKNTSAARSSSPPREADARQISSQPTLGQAASKRRLDFSSVGRGGPHSLSQPPPKTNGHRLHPLEQQEEEEEDSVESFVEKSMAMLNGDDDELPAQPEPEPVHGELSEGDDDETSMVGDDTMRISAAQQKKAGRPAKAKDVATEKPAGKPVKGRPGRKPAAAKKVVEEPQEEDEEEEEEEEQEPTPKPQPPAGKRGRPAKADKPPTPQSIPAPAAARGRKKRSLEEPPAAPEEPSPQPQAKRIRTEAGPPPNRKSPAVAAKKTTTQPKSKSAAAAQEPAAEKPKRGRKRKSSVGEGDVSQVAISRRPPLPKSRGLLINRREVPGDSDSMFRTRSGRNSFKPLAFWRNEQAHYENDEAEDTMMGNSSSKGKRNKFVLPKIKEIIRVNEPEPEFRPRSRRGRAGASSKTKKQRRYQDQREEEDYLPPEAWETNPGTVTGEVVVWQPQYEFAPPAPMDLIDVMDKQIAISGSAIKTTEVVGGEFRYAKMFSEGFISAGVVDLPAGAVKRMKNSRKVFMIFFVHVGRVLATVQATSFRISKGGVFIVPRFNEYTIENDSDNPARLFFAQGQEVTAQQLAESESTMMIHAQTDGEEEEGDGQEEEESEESVEE